MIEKISIEDFKSYRRAELKLSPLTVLIGANASGKSNALEAIRFLSWLAQGQQLSQLQYTVNNDDDRIVRGTTTDLFRFEHEAFTLQCYTDQERFNTLELTIEARQDGELHIASESLFETTDDGQPYYLYRTVSKSDGIRTGIKLEYNNFARGGKKPQITATDQKAIFLQLDSPARFSAGHDKAMDYIPEVTKGFASQLASILFLDPSPYRMRGYSYLSDRRLKDNGENLSSVLFHLLKEKGNYNRTILLQLISHLPEQKITDFNFLSGPRGEVMVQLIETFGGTERKVDAALLSDGTLRILAFAAALLSAPSGSMVVIEEIDNGLHPSRAEKLLYSIQEVAKQRGLSILLSSHNPALLDALPKESIPKVVFCYRDQNTGCSQLVRVEDLPHYADLIVQGSLGDLLTRGLIDKFVKNVPSEAGRKEEALKWLAALK